MCYNITMNTTQHICKVCGGKTENFIMNDLGGMVQPFKYYIHKNQALCNYSGDED